MFSWDTVNTLPSTPAQRAASHRMLGSRKQREELFRAMSAIEEEQLNGLLVRVYARIQKRQQHDNKLVAISD